MKRIKTHSKYIPHETISFMFNNLWEQDEIIFRILHKTGMRISEVKEYVRKAIKENKEFIRMTPAKKNWDRIIPNYLSSRDVELLLKISLETDALKKRVRRFPWPNTIYSPHDFRATFISNALTKDLNPLKVQRLVGHKELESTLKYARLTTENDLWMYDYIVESPDEWTKSSDIAFLKEQIKMLSEQNAKLKDKLEIKKIIKEQEQTFTKEQLEVLLKELPKGAVPWELEENRWTKTFITGDKKNTITLKFYLREKVITYVYLNNETKILHHTQPPQWVYDAFPEWSKD